QRLRLALLVSVVVQVLDDGPCDRDAVVGTRSTTDFIHQDQASMAEVVEDTRGFRHLHHESGLSTREVVAGPDTGKDLVNDTDTRTLGGHKTSDLLQQHDKGRLS